MVYVLLMLVTVHGGIASSQLHSVEFATEQACVEASLALQKNIMAEPPSKGGVTVNAVCVMRGKAPAS